MVKNHYESVSSRTSDSIISMCWRGKERSKRREQAHSLS